MGLFTPWGLAASAALPVILVLWLLRRRRQDQPVSSTFLWEQVLEETRANAPWQRLRRHLLLYLQLLTALAIALALAQPYLRAAGAGGGHLVILLDLSGSMQAKSAAGPTRFALAKEEARRLIDGLGPRDRATLVGLGPVPRVVAAGGDRAALRSALEDLAPGNSGADLGQGLSLVASLQKENPGLRAVVLTDGGLPAPAGETAAEIRVLGEPAPNLAVEHLQVERGQALARVGLGTGAGAPFTVELYADGRLVGSRAGSVSPAARTAELLWQQVPAAEVYEARLVGKGDALAADDIARTVVIGESRLRALLVSEGNVFLERALRLRPGLELVQAKPGAYAPGDYQLYIFDGWLPPQLPQAALMLVAPPAGGLFPLGDLAAVGNVEAVPGSLAAGLPVDDVHVARARTLSSPLPWASPILVAGDQPLVLGGNWEGRPAVLTTFSLQESDLPLRVAFPVLMQQLLAELAPAAPAPAQVTAGSPVPLHLAPLTTRASVKAPDGRSVPVALPAGPFSETEQLGIYQVVEERPAGSLHSAFAVNFPTRTESGGPQAGGTLAPAGPAPQVVGTEPLRGNRPLWPWLALGAAAVMLTEWWVYSRGR